MADFVGERIKRLRSLRGMTLRKLAALAHVPQSTLSSVETGARGGGNLTLETGKRLARAFGVSLDVIAGTYDDEAGPPWGVPPGHRTLPDAKRGNALALVAVFALLLTGCATTWTHPAKSTQEYHAEFSGCQALAGQASMGKGGMAREGTYTSAHRSCMLGKGWTPQ